MLWPCRRQQGMHGVLLFFLVVAVLTSCTTSTTSYKVLIVGTTPEEHIPNNYWFQTMLQASSKWAITVYKYLPYIVPEGDPQLQEIKDGLFDYHIGGGPHYSVFAQLAVELPSSKFMLMNTVIQPKDLAISNLQASIVNNVGIGYLVGMLAGGITSTKMIGFIGGRVTPIITNYEVGFLLGVRFACRTCQISSYFTNSWANATEGLISARKLVDEENCDVIFGTAGATTAAALQWMAQRRRKVIGVTADEYIDHVRRRHGQRK